MDIDIPQTGEQVALLLSVEWADAADLWAAKGQGKHYGAILAEVCRPVEMRGDFNTKQIFKGLSLIVRDLCFSSDEQLRSSLR